MSLDGGQVEFTGVLQCKSAAGGRAVAVEPNDISQRLIGQNELPGNESLGGVEDGGTASIAANLVCAPVDGDRRAASVAAIGDAGGDVAAAIETNRSRFRRQCLGGA